MNVKNLNESQKSQSRKMSKYKQIRRDLESQIMSGKLPLGAQVPTEQELCDLHGVSRITARKALEELKEAGVIKRTRGRGSFVDGLPSKGIDEYSVVATEILVLTNSSIPVNLHDSWGEQILQQASKLLMKDGFHISLLPLEGVGRCAEAQQEYFWRRIESFGARLGGVFLFAACISESILQGLEQRKIPWVSFGKISREMTFNFVSANNLTAAWGVGTEFARAGYERVFFLGTDIRGLSNADRFLGLVQGWLEAGKRLDAIQWIPVESIEGLTGEERETFVDRLKGASGRCAILCAGDLIAFSALKACKEAGFAIPKKAGIVGGTGFSLAEHTSPTLTVLAQPMKEIAWAACEMLVEMIRGGQMQIPGRYVKSPLIRRESCPVGEVVG